MGEIIYAPLIRDMVWSYSRIKTFNDCPYRWYLRYIRKLSRKELFFSSYGSFVHKLIEQYYTGEKTKEQLEFAYLTDFRKMVATPAPNRKVFEGYFKSGLQYLRDFNPFPYKTIAVEKKIDFQIAGIPITGYIDYLGESTEGIVIVDNKSRTLKRRSKRTRPTKSDFELDEYLIQLYLYSAAVENEYGERPKSLCFNCFREPLFIEEPFSDKQYLDSMNWLFDSVSTIASETDFRPSISYFMCNYLCEMNEHCEYYMLSNKGACMQ